MERKNKEEKKKNEKQKSLYFLNMYLGLGIKAFVRPTN